MEPLPIDMRRQPDDSTCGPTCLHALYEFFGDRRDLSQLVREVPTLGHGGTLVVHLANHALERGYRATLVTWNLEVFDPSWFTLAPGEVVQRLGRQLAAKPTPRIREATAAYQRFLELGGELLFEDLEPALLRRYLRRRLPILTGLSSTFLYREPRERNAESGPEMIPDDVRGEPQGHFVLLSGYDPDRRAVYVTDPMHPNALSQAHTYAVEIHRVVGAVFLGALTHDANMLILEPVGSRPPTVA
jgi:hypothetical protein